MNSELTFPVTTLPPAQGLEYCGVWDSKYCRRTEAQLTITYASTTSLHLVKGEGVCLWFHVLTQWLLVGTYSYLDIDTTSSLVPLLHLSTSTSTCSPPLLFAAAARNISIKIRCSVAKCCKEHQRYAEMMAQRYTKLHSWIIHCSSLVIKFIVLPNSQSISLLRKLSTCLHHHDETPYCIDHRRLNNGIRACLPDHLYHLFFHFSPFHHIRTTPGR